MEVRPVNYALAGITSFFTKKGRKMSEQNGKDGNENKGSDSKIGNLKKGKISDVWKKEVEFSEWLAEKENIPRLAEVLNIDLDPESVQIEDRVGNLSADISARTSAGKPIVIENQYGTTDHKHMGQLLTYCGRDRCPNCRLDRRTFS